MKEVKVEVDFDDETVKRIEDYMQKNKIKSFECAVQKLVEIGFKQEEKTRKNELDGRHLLMTDIAIISSVLSGINSALSIAKSIKEANSSIEAASFKLQLADLMSALADSKFQLFDIKNLIIEKNNQIELLEKKIKEIVTQEKPTYQYGIYKFKDDDGNYCTRCWDDKLKKFRVTRTPLPNNVQCPECKSNFSTLS